MDKKKIGIVAAVVVVLFLFLGLVWPGFLTGKDAATTTPAIAEKIDEVVDGAKEAVEGAVEEAKEAVEGAVEQAVETVTETVENATTGE
ncbi:MAG: hypothetical protein IK127_04970 [Clostridia bacterium]|nr:hypothetical protein [Clostridia bacterium]